MRKGDWVALFFGLAAVFVLFHWVASALGSDRGQAGVLVGLIVVGATLAAELCIFGGPLGKAAIAIGLGVPALSGMLAAGMTGLLMLFTIPVFAAATDSSFTFYPGWMWLVPGLFFQAGIAEETLFRGYLFGHFRKLHPYWKAAGLAAIPFTIVHLILFFTLPWPIAAASICLAVVTTFPYSRLYELGGNTIWAPAIVHFVTQGAVKVLVSSGESAESFPLVWIAVSALVPLLVFAVPMRREGPLV